jgi:hypothetical protein
VLSEMTAHARDERGRAELREGVMPPIGQHHVVTRLRAAVETHHEARIEAPRERIGHGALAAISKSQPGYDERPSHEMNLRAPHLRIAISVLLLGVSCAPGCNSRVFPSTGLSGAYSFEVKSAVGSVGDAGVFFSASAGEVRCAGSMPKDALLIGNVATRSTLPGSYRIVRRGPAFPDETTAFVINRPSPDDPWSAREAIGGETEILEISSSTMKVRVWMIFEDGKTLAGTIPVTLCR